MTLAVVYQPPLLGDFLGLLLCDQARGLEQVLDVVFPVAYPADLAPGKRASALYIFLLDPLRGLGVQGEFLAQLFLRLLPREWSTFDYANLADWVATEFTRPVIKRALTSSKQISQT